MTYIVYESIVYNLIAQLIEQFVKNMKKNGESHKNIRFKFLNNTTVTINFQTTKFDTLIT